MGAAHAATPLCRPDRDSALFRGAAEIQAGGAGQGQGQAAASSRAAGAHRDLLRSAAVLLSAARSAGDRRRALPAQRGNPAPDGHVPLVGLAERMAAPDPRSQLFVRESAHRAAAGHRGWRLDLGRIDARQGALHVPLQRGGGAGHGVDLERDRQGAGRVASRAAGERARARISAQSPDGRRAARGYARSARVKLRSGHRTGGLVRCAGAHLQGRRRRAARHVSAVRARAAAAGHDRARSVVAGLCSRQGGPTVTQLALIIDLNVCVGCHACVTSCKEWNTSGVAGYLSDDNPYGKDPTGAFFNRVQTFEVGEYPNTETVHFPKSCLHCEDPPCVPVCPTGASYKRPEDGIVLVDYDKCIGCKYCAWACPYGVRELDEHQKVMKKCTLCVDRIYDDKLPAAERKPACVMACPTSARLFGDIHDPDSEVSQAIRDSGGYTLMPEWATQPANHYLPRRKTQMRIHRDELERVDNPLKIDGQLPKPAVSSPSLDDVTSW